MALLPTPGLGRVPTGSGVTGAGQKATGQAESRAPSLSHFANKHANNPPPTSHPILAGLQHAFHLTVAALETMQAAPGKKKPYRPPRPDANTFSTQHEFLESLTPVPADSVGEKDRKCAHCWKRFGEADPGLDNAEEPVRFRCGHVFGERCMKELFCPPEAVRIDMLPLSFAPGSRGAELGRRLSAYVDQCGVDKGALLIGGKREKDFTRLLNEVQNANRGYEILGKEWYPRVHQAMHPNLNLHDVHLLENAVIFDVGIPEPKGKPTFIPEYTTAAVGYIPSMPTEWTATSTEDLLALADEAQHLYEAAKNATPDSSNASSTPVSSINNNGLPSFASLLGALHGDVDVPDHDPSFATTTSEPVSQPDTPGSAKTVAEITSELLAEDQALIEMMSTLEDPALAMDSPAYVAYQQMMEHYSETATEGSIPSSEDGPEPMEGVEQPSTDTAAEPLQGKLPSIHEALSSAETGGTAPGAWKDKLPKVSKLDKLVSLQKSQADAKQAFKAAKKSEASIKASKEASQRRAAKAKGTCYA